MKLGKGNLLPEPFLLTLSWIGVVFANRRLKLSFFICLFFKM